MNRHDCFQAQLLEMSYIILLVNSFSFIWYCIGLLFFSYAYLSLTQNYAIHLMGSYVSIKFPETLPYSVPDKLYAYVNLKSKQ